MTLSLEVFFPAGVRPTAALLAALLPSSVSAADPGPAPGVADGAGQQRLIARYGVADDARWATVAWQQDWPWVWRQIAGGSGELGDATEVALGYGHPVRDMDGSSRNGWQLGVTPILGYSVDGPRGWFVEAGIGANLITPLYRANSKGFSTAFNFGDHLGFGWRSGGARAWRWSLRDQHFSNAKVKVPNPGENFVQL